MRNKAARTRRALAAPQEPTGLSGLEGDGKELWDGFPVFKALRQHPEGEGLNAGDRVHLGHAVSHDPGQGWDLSDSPAISFLLDFNPERHGPSIGVA